MKLRTTFFISIIIAFSLFASVSHAELSITCTVFPVYDFTREITKGLADVKLLIRGDVHEYEPSPMDIKALNDSDVFIFTNKNLEQWTERISQSLTHTIIVNPSEKILVYNNDPHIWLDMSLSVKMIENITNALCKADPEHADIFMKNAGSYAQKLSELDSKFMAMKKDRALVFAGEFSYGYFIRRYGFDYVSAYEGENEPSVRRMAEVMKYIRDNHTRYVFSDFNGTSRITNEIASETGAEILTFNTAHNVPSDDITFLEIMNKNYENIARAMMND